MALTSLYESPLPINLYTITLALNRHNRPYTKWCRLRWDVCVKSFYLTRKDKPFHWGEDRVKAFNDLKPFLSTPVLRRPEFDIPFEIDNDASNVTVGACLKQRIEGKPRAVAYFSRKLKGTGVRYSATDTEALAVVESVYGRSFEVFTDHRPLIHSI